MPTGYPLPKFHFIVEWGGTRIEFSEVTGLSQDTQTNNYRDGSSSGRASIKNPVTIKSGNISLRRGIALDGSNLLQWLSRANPKQMDRRDLDITLLNHKNEPVVRWKICNAFPIKVVGPMLQSSGNDVAIESIEIAHEGIELQKT